jgi:NAD(P)-dependent dehydrogenase (short-subunit alcohol dehydrogenase family)
MPLFTLLEKLLPGMLKRKSGTVVFVPSSGAAPYMGAYEVFKTAQVELCNTLAGELEGTGVITFSIGPGIVKTDFNINVWKDEQNARQVGSMVPLGRLAEPGDIAGPALFLASDESRYITGAVINVDGGWQATPGRMR